MSVHLNRTNHYTTLEVDAHAPLGEIKQAYRRLVKKFHPDCNHDLRNHDDIAAINQAYETLSNSQSRASYDRQLGLSSANFAPRNHKPSNLKHPPQRHEDQRIDQWRHHVYEPIMVILEEILDSLSEQIDDLAADPYDEDLMENFETYLAECRGSFAKAQIFFRSMANPAVAAGVASHLYHCLNAVSDGIEELHFFTLNFDDRHLHTGQELWRRAEEMRYYAQLGMQSLIQQR
jgi:molecular chaperone DnaJ